MNDKEKLKFLKDKFHKVCINVLPAGQPYKNPELYNSRVRLTIEEYNEIFENI